MCLCWKHCLVNDEAKLPFIKVVYTAQCKTFLAVFSFSIIIITTKLIFMNVHK